MIAGAWGLRPLAGLAAAALVPAVLWALPVLHLAANRLVTGEPVPAAAALGPWLWPVAGLAALGPGLAAAGRGRTSALLAGLACGGALVLLLAGLGAGAADLLADRPSTARARLASGAWIAGLGLCVAVVAAARRTRWRPAGWLAGGGLAAALAGPAAAGALDALSLVQEFHARRDGLARALVDHLALSGGALGLAALVTGGLGLWRRGRGTVDLLVGGVQVIPAVALFGGLVAAASALLATAPVLRTLGLSALGAGPALVGIAAYLLLPLWRGLQGALRAPDPAALDAARALGLAPVQILTGLRLPLGAPVLIGGLRVAAVQAIGLATLGALVGAGGLGRLVFDGMAQFAPDLILLGALPVIALSLATERALSGLEAAARRRWPS